MNNIFFFAITYLFAFAKVRKRIDKTAVSVLFLRFFGDFLLKKPYRETPWDYVANHISWRVGGGNIYIHFREDDASVVISDYHLTDSRCRRQYCCYARQARPSVREEG